MVNLDIVISVCSAPAHLAGALSKTTWILLPFNADWRWLLHEKSSIWYKTAQLFRQAQRSDWDSVVQTVRQALIDFKK